VIDSSLEHAEKAFIPIEVTDEGILIEVKLEHPEKALIPIETTDEGILIEVKLEHPLKVLVPIEEIDVLTDGDMYEIYDYFIGGNVDKDNILKALMKKG